MLSAALAKLRAQAVPCRGPFVTFKGVHAYVVDECILTREEIISLFAAGQFDRERIARLLSHIRQNQKAGTSKWLRTETNLANQRRSHRVTLHVGVLLAVGLPEGKPRQIQAFTHVVNAHGGLLEAPVKLAASQRITLANLLTGETAACKVVQVEGFSDPFHKISFEFEECNPRFWPVPSPPTDWFAPE